MPSVKYFLCCTKSFLISQLFIGSCPHLLRAWCCLGSPYLWLHHEVCSLPLPLAVKISGFMLCSLIHLNLISVQDEREGSGWILLLIESQFPQHHLLVCLFSNEHFQHGWYQSGGRMAEYLSLLHCIYLHASEPVPCRFYQMALQCNLKSATMGFL